MNFANTSKVHQFLSFLFVLATVAYWKIFWKVLALNFPVLKVVWPRGLDRLAWPSTLFFVENKVGFILREASTENAKSKRISGWSTMLPF